MALFGLYASNTEENSFSSNQHFEHLGYMQQSNYNEPPFPQNFLTNSSVNGASSINSINDAPSTMSFESSFV